MFTKQQKWATFWMLKTCKYLKSIHINENVHLAYLYTLQFFTQTQLSCNFWRKKYKKIKSNINCKINFEKPSEKTFFMGGLEGFYFSNTRVVVAFFDPLYHA